VENLTSCRARDCQLAECLTLELVGLPIEPKIRRYEQCSKRGHANGSNRLANMKKLSDTGQEISAALFDLGGVLVPDPWETFFFTPIIGLADRLELDRTEVMREGGRLWDKACRFEWAEIEYWTSMEESLRVRIPQSLISELRPTAFRPNPHARSVLTAISNQGIKIGVISDNTSFWYPMQKEALGLDDFVSSEYIFLSFREHVTKRNYGINLLTIAARVLDPELTLVVDDRLTNLESATQEGFRTTHYSMDSNADELQRLVSLHLPSAKN
jgi:FMN phosphatase YigB (HAD superfamily)